MAQYDLVPLTFLCPAISSASGTLNPIDPASNFTMDVRTTYFFRNATTLTERRALLASCFAGGASGKMSASLGTVTGTPSIQHWRRTVDPTLGYTSATNLSQTISAGNSYIEQTLATGLNPGMAFETIAVCAGAGWSVTAGQYIMRIGWPVDRILLDVLNGGAYKGL